MSIPVGQLTIEMAANVVRLQKDMDNAKRMVGSAMSDIKKSADMAVTALGAIGAGLSVNAFAGWIKGAIDAADSLNDLNKSTSIAVGELAGLKLAAKKSGGDLEGTAQAINKLSVNIANDVKKFAAIGITAKDPLEAFKQLADIFSSIQDPQLRAALGAEALGKSWASAAPMLAEGGAKIGEMVEKGKQLSGITPEMVAASDAFNDTLAEMSTQMGGVATKIAAELLPSLQTISDAMNEAGQSTDSFSIAATGVKTIFDTIVVLGANVGYVLKMTGLEISGIMQQLAAAATLDFAGAAAIGDRMKADAVQARKDIDAFSEKIINGNKSTVEAQDKATKSTASNTAEVEKNVRAFISSNKEKAAGVDVYAKMIKSADDLVASIKFEADAYSMSNVEKETAIALQKLMNMGLKEGTAEYEKYTEAVIGAVIEKEQMKSLSDMKRKTESDDLKAAEKLVADRIKEEEKFADEVKEINNQIGQSLTDALMSGGMNARDFIVNMFKTMVLRPILQPLITGVVGAVTGSALSGSAMAADGAGGSLTSSLGLLDIGSKLKSAYDLVAGGFAGIGESVGAVVANFSGAAEGAAALMASSGGEASLAAIAQMQAAGAVGASATLLATSVAGIGAGIGLGTLISGDKSIIGGSGMIATGAGTAIGAAIGTAILPGVGTAIGAALGGIVGGIANQFGNAPKEITDFGIGGSLSSNGSNIQNYSEWEKKGGWFGSDKNGAEFTAVESRVSKYINASVAGSAIAVRQYADVLGLPADGIADFTFEIKRSMEGLTAEEATKALNELLTQYGNALAANVTSEIGPFIRDGEEAGAALARLATSLKSVNSIFDTLNIKLYDTSLFSADAASKLADMFGGLDKLLAATDAYYQAFYSAQERADKTTSQLSDVFNQLGLSMPQTNAQFRAMVEAARSAGNDGLFAALIKLAPAFNELKTSLSALVDQTYATLQQAIEAEQKTALAALNSQKTIIQAQKDVASESVNALQSIFDYLSGQVSDLMQTVDAAYTAAQGSAFIRDAVLAANSTGYLPDQSALSDAVSAARSGLASSNFASAYDQKLAQALLLAQLSDLNIIAGDQKTTAELQLEIAQEQLDSIDAQIASTQDYYDAQLIYAQAQINELKGLNGGILTVADAMASFGAAVNASRMTVDSGMSGQINALYQEILGRSAESAGLANWLTSGKSIDEIRQGIINSDEARLRGYASGGSYPGGLAMVGESGPELINFNRPGQVYSAGQTSEILNNGLTAEIQALREDLRAQSRSNAQIQSRTAKVLERWDGDGLPVARVEA